MYRIEGSRPKIRMQDMVQERAFRDTDGKACHEAAFRLRHVMMVLNSVASKQCSRALVLLMGYSEAERQPGNAVVAPSLEHQLRKTSSIVQ